MAMEKQLAVGSDYRAHFSKPNFSRGSWRKLPATGQEANVIDHVVFNSWPSSLQRSQISGTVEGPPEP